MRPGEADTRRELEGVEGVEQRENRQRENEKKKKETCAHISNYLFKLPSHHIDPQRNCDMNLDGTCMEMKCLKVKYGENQNLEMFHRWFESIFNI